MRYPARAPSISGQIPVASSRSITCFFESAEGQRQAVGAGAMEQPVQNFQAAGVDAVMPAQRSSTIFTSGCEIATLSTASSEAGSIDEMQGAVESQDHQAGRGADGQSPNVEAARRVGVPSSCSPENGSDARAAHRGRGRSRATAAGGRWYAVLDVGGKEQGRDEGRWRHAVVPAGRQARLRGAEVEQPPTACMMTAASAATGRCHSVGVKNSSVNRTKSAVNTEDSRYGRRPKTDRGPGEGIRSPVGCR